VGCDDEPINVTLVPKLWRAIHRLPLSSAGCDPRDFAGTPENGRSAIEWRRPDTPAPARPIARERCRAGECPSSPLGLTGALLFTGPTSLAPLASLSSVQLPGEDSSFFRQTAAGSFCRRAFVKLHQLLKAFHEPESALVRESWPRVGVFPRRAARRHNSREIGCRLRCTSSGRASCRRASPSCETSSSRRAPFCSREFRHSPQQRLGVGVLLFV